MSIRQDILYDAFISTPIDLEMVNLVSRVRRCGYRTGMVTDNKVDRIGSIIEHHHWKTLFDVVTVSAEVGSRKAEEAIFLKTLMELGLEAGECVFIDNNHANLAVPTKMGMKTVHFDDKERSMPMLKNALHGMGFNL